MPPDYQRPSRIAADQQRALADYLRWDVRPYSSRYGPLLTSTPFERLPLTELSEATDAETSRAFVLRPEVATMRSKARLGDRLRPLPQKVHY